MRNPNGFAARRVRAGRRAGTWLCALGFAGGVGAETFTVTTNADMGTGSLRAALTAAAADDSEPHTIEFAAALDGQTIALASALPDVGRVVTFDTQGRAVTLDGSDAGITQPYLTVTSIVTFDGLSFQGGEVRTGPPGTLYIIQADRDVTIGSDFSNDVGAAFSFDKDGSATATITSDVVLSSAIGDAFGGTLQIANGGSFELASFNVNDTATLEVLSGGSASFGSLDVRSGGTLTGGGAVATTDTTIRSGATLSGALMLDAGSAFTLESGADLVGGGTITATDVALSGRTAPDTTSGTLTFNGATVFASGSAYEADLQDDGDGDRIDVNGAVTIQPGAQLVTRLDPAGDYSSGLDVTVLDYDSVSGTFDLSTDSSFLFLTQTPVYGANALVIQLDPTAPDLDLTPNQQHVLDVVNAATPDPDGDLDVVQNVLNATFQGDEAAYGELLDAIGGESHTAFATGRQLLGERTARALHRRMRDPAWGAARAVYAADATAPAPVFAGPRGAPLGWRALAPAASPPVSASPVAAPGSRTRVGAWLDAFGQIGTLEGGDSGEADLDTLLYGGTLGVDAWLADRVVLGLAAGYARADLDLDDRAAELTGDTIQGALYAGYADPRGHLSAYGRYAYTFQDAARRIAAPQLYRTATASWDAQDYGAGAEAGVTLVSLGTFGLQPIVGVDWLQLTEESYRESGGGSLSLDVDPDDLESTTARFGGRIFGELDLDEAGRFVPELRAFWQREYGDRDRVLRARLLGASTGGALAVRGAEMPRDVVILGLGWSAELGELVEVLLDYDALLDADRVEHQGSVAVRARF